ncbi:MAG: hypothetical protein MJZ86_03430 [Bacteroidales bacterium]|nr:hypothetical protein [Bacteroidales bacterium]
MAKNAVRLWFCWAGWSHFGGAFATFSVLQVEVHILLKKIFFTKRWLIENKGLSLWVKKIG